MMPGKYFNCNSTGIKGNIDLFRDINEKLLWKIYVIYKIDKLLWKICFGDLGACCYIFEDSMKHETLQNWHFGEKQKKNPLICGNWIIDMLVLLHVGSQVWRSWAFERLCSDLFSLYEGEGIGS